MKIKKFLNNLNSNNQIVENDRIRHEFAMLRDYKSLGKTYTKKYDVKNLNTGKYWNTIFDNNETLTDQSPMTKDKISIIANLIPEGPKKILDLGIGQGFLEEKLLALSKRHNCFGIDISAHAIKRAKGKFRGEFTTDSVHNIRNHYSKNSFDVIVAIELLEHINASAIFSLYKDVRSLLNKNGMLIISIPINEHLEKMNNNPSAHVRDYSQETIKAELVLNRFYVIQTFKLYAFKKLID